MKKLFIIGALISFFICCLLLRQIYRNDSRDQLDLLWGFGAALVILVFCILALTSKEKFKPVPGREYEILEWTKLGDKHSMCIRYLDKNNEYEHGTIKWEGDAEFRGSANYQANKYFIRTSMVGLVFSSVDFAPAN